MFIDCRCQKKAVHVMKLTLVGCILMGVCASSLLQSLHGCPFSLFPFWLSVSANKCLHTSFSVPFSDESAVLPYSAASVASL